MHRVNAQKYTPKKKKKTFFAFYAFANKILPDFYSVCSATIIYKILFFYIYSLIISFKKIEFDIWFAFVFSMLIRFDFVLFLLFSPG